MTEEITFILDDAKEQMQKALLHMETELTKIRTGKANPSMLDSVFFDYYGVNTQLNQAATISIPDARTIMIKPWEKGLLPDIEKAIHASNLGLNPMNDGETIRINIPPLTEERRQALVKQARQIGENSKVSIRNVRRDSNEEIKKLEKEGLSEDQAKAATDNVQELTDTYSAKIEAHLKRKEEDIMKV
ncbi:MAG: ribosome recycling factor [Chitinophagales bacterium]